MLINVINVALSQAPGNKYQIAEVVYKDERLETKTKKLMSFANPATYATLKDAKNGDFFEITTVKNDKGFWDWTSAAKTDAASAGKPAAAPSTSRSSYETTEERARRQVLIVKQSSLAQAVEFAKGDEVEPTLEGVLAIAQTFADWVLADDKIVLAEEVQ